MHLRTTLRPAALATTAILVGALVAAQPIADANGRTSLTVRDDFTRRGADEVSPPGQSVLADCQRPGRGVETWPRARASLLIDQADGASRVTILIRHARPDTYFTVWLRLGGTDSAGRSFGGNPVTDGQATALAATRDLPDLLASTGTGNGNDEQPNGFRTDGRGNAILRTWLDFPVVGGAYPWQRFPDWDPTDPRLPGADPAVHPVAIAGPQGPYTLRIVSHCTDDVGHGLVAGPREWWFDWTVAR